MQEIRNTTFWAIIISASVLLCIFFYKNFNSISETNAPFELVYASNLHSNSDTITMSDGSINKTYEFYLTAKNNNGMDFMIDLHEEFYLRTYNINSNIYLIPSGITQGGSYNFPNNIEFERIEKLKFYLNEQKLVDSEVELCYHTRTFDSINFNRPSYEINVTDNFKNLKKLIEHNHVDTISYWQPPKHSLHNYELTVCRLFTFRHIDNEIVVNIQQKDKFKEEYFKGKVLVEDGGNIIDSLNIVELISNKYGILGVE